MNEILQKRIEEAAKRYAWSHDTIGVDKETFHTESSQKAPIPIHKEVRVPIHHEMEVVFNCAAHFILNNLWISVEEALPTLDEKYDFSERYIVRTQNNEIKVMRIFRNIAWCDIYRGGAYIPFEKDIVTHWMPIPSLEGGEK